MKKSTIQETRQCAENDILRTKPDFILHSLHRVPLLLIACSDAIFKVERCFGHRLQWHWHRRSCLRRLWLCASGLLRLRAEPRSVGLVCRPRPFGAESDGRDGLPCRRRAGPRFEGRGDVGTALMGCDCAVDDLVKLRQFALHLLHHESEQTKSLRKRALVGTCVSCVFLHCGDTGERQSTLTRQASNHKLWKWPEAIASKYFVNLCHRGCEYQPKNGPKWQTSSNTCPQVTVHLCPQHGKLPSVQPLSAARPLLLRQFPAAYVHRRTRAPATHQPTQHLG